MKKQSIKRDKQSCNNKMVILMIICVLLSLITLGIVAYDKLIRSDSNDCSQSDVTWRECWNK